MEFPTPNRNRDTIANLVDQVDPCSLWSYIGECEVILDNGARCYQPAVGYWTANGGLRNIEMCQFHVLMMMSSLLERLDE